MCLGFGKASSEASAAYNNHQTVTPSSYCPHTANGPLFTINLTDHLQPFLDIAEYVALSLALLAMGQNETDGSKRMHTNTFHELQDTIMSSEGEEALAFFPPPRIAARFFQIGKNRRKSSAASSRQNSISSHHSSRSVRSGGPHNTHIAQHLRRASILESRRARLADKAEHAEKVRLRAAQVKAASRISTTSERAAAAEKARNRYLAQVVARSAEEVQRAKRVAEETRERKAARHLELKGHMEERHAGVERRRLLYQQSQRRTRTAILAPVEEKKVLLPRNRNRKPITEPEAARLIQRAWRNWKNRRIVRDFQELGLTVGNIHNTSFEDVGGLISSEKVLSRTANILKLCGLQDQEGGGIGEKTAVRSFLSAFLVVCHPMHVMDKSGVQEQDLIDKAEHLLSSFDSILSRSPKIPQFSPLASQLATLADAFSAFQTAFTAWKAHDSSLLVQTMIAQFVQLDSIWQMVKDDTEGEVANEYREGIKHNQAQILARLKRLVGRDEALQMVSESVRASRKEKQRKRRTEDRRPRAGFGAASLSLADGNSNDADRSSVESLASDQSQPAADVARDVWSNLIPDNRTIVHEVAINKGYRVDLRSSTAHGYDGIMQALNHFIRAHVQSGAGDAGWIVKMAEILRRKLLGLVRPGNSLHTLISETLDLKLLTEQVSIGLFSFEQFFSFMENILPKLCAPARDADVEAFATDPIEDPIKRLAKLNHVIDLISVDHINFMIQMSAPVLIREAASYEHSCFAKMLGDSEPQKTKQWWNSAKAKVVATISGRSTEAGSSSLDRLTSERIYSQGLVDLAIAMPLLKMEQLPETLELDHERILRMQSDTLRIITIGSVLLAAKSLLKRDVRIQWQAEAERMWDLPFDDSPGFLSVIESGHPMPPASKRQLCGTIEIVFSDAWAKQPTHPVMKVLFNKLKLYMISRLWTSSSEDRVKASTGARAALTSIGLGEFVRQVNLMVDELARMREVDRAAHGKWYDQISTMAASSSSDGAGVSA